VIEDGRSGIIVDTYREMPAALERADKLEPLELRRYVEEEFSPQRMVSDYVGAYETAISRAT
jgi:glycosyltransferase involved in cell wall biosynthesis